MTPSTWCYEFKSAIRYADEEAARRCLVNLELNQIDSQVCSSEDLLCLAEILRDPMLGKGSISWLAAKAVENSWAVLDYEQQVVVTGLFKEVAESTKDPMMALMIAEIAGEHLEGCAALEILSILTSSSNPNCVGSGVHGLGHLAKRMSGTELEKEIRNKLFERSCDGRE